MRVLIFCAVTLSIVIVAAEDILEDEDIALVQDKKWFPELYDCLMDREPCPERMVIYRETIPKYLETKCGSCSSKEKDLFEKLTKVVAEKYPIKFKEITNKFLPKAH